MAASFIKPNDQHFAQQIYQFGQQLPNYLTILGITATEQAQAQADAAYMKWIIDCLEITRQFSESWTNFKDNARNGVEGLPLNPPVAPEFPEMPPVAVPSGIEERFSKLAARCKSSRNYTKAIGESLGIEIPQSDFNPNEGKPEVKIRLNGDGKPEILWKKGKFDGVAIERREENGNFTRLDTDLRPNYTDNSAIAPAGQAKKYYYRLRYLYKEALVGFWSDEVAITVTG